MPRQDRSCAPAQRPPMPRAEEKQTLSVPRCTPVEFFDMAAPHFVHLRMHSEYSVTDGIVRIEQAVKRAAADGMPALALTDSANLFGMVKFYGAARAAGVKPIVGADCWVQNEADRDKPHRLLLLCASRAGYRRLCELLSRAWLRNQHRARAEIARGWLQESGTDGLIALSAAAAGDVGQALLSDQSPLAERLARDWAKLFPGRYYIELQRAGFANAEALLSRSVALATRVGLTVVATHPVQFLEPGDFKAHEARVCIAQGYVLGDQRRPKLFTGEQYFKRCAEMVKLFADLPQALDNSVEIARRCNLEIELGKSRLPAFPTPPGVTIDQYLENAAEAGLARRLEKLGLGGDAAARYRERLAFEIRTIVQMGFAGYFLIVADFINWAKTNGVPVGPGRGSGAGSLVAYSLGITDLDPLRYDLLFERFLNPERISMPDFDIDFCQDGRERVISQLDKDDVEAIGLVKFDFLGLTTLTVLDLAERSVRAMGHPEFALARIPLDDAATYQLLSAGNTTTVFQLESRGMRDLIRRARPDRFEDVIALVALYRPGPMDLIPDFIARKHGEQRVDYLDARLQPILGPTYG